MSKRWALPAIPTLISPVDGAIVDNGCIDRSDPVDIRFEWSSVPGAVTYHLYVIGAGEGLYPLIDTDVTGTTYRHLSPDSYVVERNRYGWRWKVRALAEDTWGDDSPEGTFDFEPLNTDCPGL